MEAVERAGTSFYSYPYPVCKAGNDLRSVFRDYLDDDATRSLVESTAQAKAIMLACLVDKTMNFEQRIEAVDQYLHALRSVHESLLTKGGVKVSQNPVFEWTLFVQGGAAESFKSADMVFELLMLLHLKALLHYYRARGLLSTDSRAFLSEAAKQCLQVQCQCYYSAAAAQQFNAMYLSYTYVFYVCSVCHVLYDVITVGRCRENSY
ncbi:hypothetical protein EON64_05475 [archaeon]|nr:MAG: hypothetical protein EON64_05475 [archaeon]